MSAQDADFASKCLEFELEIEKINSHVEHLKSQNKVLVLALEESKSTCDSLTELLGKYESNNTALQLSLSYCDSMIESYDVLVALLETSAEERTTATAASRERDRSNRKKAETVARHLLSRAERHAHQRPDSGLAVSHLDTTWEDSSGYSQTTSSCSTSSSGMDQDQDNMEENRVKEYISQLKVGRAGVQATVLELESVHGVEGREGVEGLEGRNRARLQHTEEEMEVAVLLQEICALREERADIRAQLYLVSREKEGLELEVQEEKEQNKVLEIKIGIIMDTHQYNQYPGKLTDEREKALQARIQTLLKSLEKVSKTSELRQKQSLDLIEDLKRANSVLTGALEHAKKKYQNKLRRLELRLTAGAPLAVNSLSAASLGSSTKS